MTGPLRVLSVEDSETDAKLLLRTLRAGGRLVELQRVEDREAMQRALADGTFDVVLADWALPRFSGLEALAVLRESGLDLPFLVVSGTVGEEVAVEAMRAGAHDYVLKDKLTRLAPAVEREVREKVDRDARRAADEAVKLQAARFQALIEHSVDGITVSDRDQRVLYASPGARTILGFDQRDLVGESIGSTIHPEDRASATAARGRLLAGSPVESTEVRIVRPDGVTRWIEVSLVNRLDDPAVAGVVANFRDITDRRRLLDAVRESEARFRALIERSDEGISLADVAARLRYVSPGGMRILGFAEGATAEVRYEVHPDDRARVGECSARIREKPGATETILFRILRPDRAVRWLEVILVNRLDDPLVGAVVSNFRDVTDRELVLDALRESELRFRRLWESGMVGAAIADGAGRYVEVNDALLDIVGYTREELDAGLVRWDEMTPPEWRASNLAAGQQLTTHGRARPWEKEYLRKDGSRAGVLVAVASLSGTRNLALVVDLSAQRKAEQDQHRAESALEHTEAQLRQAQKMEAVGRLAGGVAHDFNNLLSVILGYGELCLQDMREGDPLRADIREICNAGKRAADLTSQLLMFSRQQVLEPKVMDLNDVLMDMDKMLRRVLGEDVDLTFAPTRPLGLVLADKSSIEQVVMNLAVNARDAMPTGGLLTIEIGDVELDGEFVRSHVGMSPGPYVMLAVTDTGTGMDEETQAHAFEPFFTTKEVGKGTGLGLSTVFGIVHQSGGAVRLRSDLGKGTTFEVYLPRVAGTVSPVSAAPRHVDERCTETILLVEDEDPVRAVARDILQRSGYRVIEARNAAEALLHAERLAGAIDLLLTDVVMPQMSGPVLAKRLVEDRPDLKVICMSGYTDDSIVRHGALESGMTYLQKPITPDALRRKVREVLDAPNRR